MIYFDNSATSHTKPSSTIKNINLALTDFSSNPGRSGHDLSLKSSIAVMSARESLCQFFGGDNPQNVIFTQNCTDSLNIAILGVVKRGWHIITTVNEHNSVLRPLHYLEKTGQISVSVVPTDEFGRINRQSIEKHLRSNTRLVITNHVSNVNGDETDIYSIGKMCKERKIIYLVDTAQSAGHKKIDMSNDNIDIVAIAGHKGLLGPQGIGALIFKDGINIEPRKFGGTGTNSTEFEMPDNYPERLECGTLNLVGIMGLLGGLEFVKEHFEEIEKKTKELSLYFLKRLNEVSNIIIYTHSENPNGVIAFNIKNVSSTTVADYLNANKIYVRSGLHCAPLKHKNLRTTESGIVRASVSYFNTLEEIDNTISILKNF